MSTTARQAAELGYDVVLAEDAIGDRDIPGLKGDEVTKVRRLRCVSFPGVPVGPFLLLA